MKFITDGKFFYGVRIVTGSHQKIAISPYKVNFSLTGTKASSGSISLSRSDGLFGLDKHSFKHSTFDDLIVQSNEDLGEVEVIGLSLEQLSHDRDPDLLIQWYVEFITLVDYKESKEITFPCYHWIDASGKQVTCTSKTSKCSLCLWMHI